MPTPLLTPAKGEMGARTAAHAWESTGVGPIAGWPLSLTTAVGMVLHCELPMYLAWGPGLTQFYNDAYMPILGLRHPAALGASARETWPEIWPTIGPMWEAVLAGRSIGFNDFRLTIERNGYPEDCYFNFSYSPVADDSGRPAGVLVTFVETTDRVHAERRARFQLELSDALRGLSDPSDITELTCRKLGELLGLRRAGYARIRDGMVHVDLRGWYDETVGSVLGSSFPLQAVGPQVADSLLRGETVCIDDVHQDPRTREFPAVYDKLRASGMLIVPVMRHGQLIAVVAASAKEPRHWQASEVQLTEDAAERTRAAVERAVAELALKRQQDSERDRMRALFDQAPIFMASLRGPEHRFELVNPAYEALVNLRGLVGKTVAEVLPEAVEQGYLQLLDTVFATGRAHVAIDAPLQLYRAGAARPSRYVDFIYQPIVDAAGAVSGIFVVGSDVTERHEAELALKEADRRKDEFLAMLAHELRNPLAPISAAADLLRLRGSTDDGTRRAAGVIARQVKHMTGLINDLLDVSRVTRGLVKLDLAPLDLKRVVAEAVEQARPQIEARGHVLAVEAHAQAALVNGDSERLVQVVGNLLSNATKYTPHGGRIELSTWVEDGSVVITVRDNGIGMDASMLQQAFELFVQADRSVDRSQGGLGIGLALVRSLVRMHGGTVEAHSDGAGRGSCFTVKLPQAASVAQTGGPGTDSAAPATRQSFDILLVDDNIDAAAMLSMSLEAAGHRVRVQHASLPALLEARRQPPQVCLLDIGLPELDGYGLAAQLRTDARTTAATLIAITGYGQDKDRRAALEAGFDHHFTKPVDLGALQIAMAHGRRAG